MTLSRMYSEIYLKFGFNISSENNKKITQYEPWNEAL